VETAEEGFGCAYEPPVASVENSVENFRRFREGVYEKAGVEKALPPTTPPPLPA